jgi:hypothetical protein
MRHGSQTPRQLSQSLRFGTLRLQERKQYLIHESISFLIKVNRFHIHYMFYRVYNLITYEARATDTAPAAMLKIRLD